MHYGNEFKKYATKHLNINPIVVDQVISMTPNILEERKMNVAVLDVFSRMLYDRILFLGDEVNPYTANVINAQLLFLESVDAKKDITLHVSSPGGCVQSGLSITDSMNYISPDVSTVNISLAASMGSIVLSSGTKGKRYSLKHARVLLHQPSGGFRGQATDMEINFIEIQKFKKELYNILAENTGKDYDTIWKDCERDYWLTAEEAKEYGLIDEILTKRIV